MCRKPMLRAVLGWMWVLASGCASAQALPTIEELPLVKGTRFTYGGTRTTAAGTKDVALTIIDVREVKIVAGRTAARLSADVRDLAFDDRKPRETWIIKSGARYSRAASADAPGEPFLELPLTTGRRICPPTEPEEPRLCWIVDSVGRGRVAARGAPAAELVRYTLVQRDNTGTQTMEVVPGVGIVGYRYHHHGSPADVDVRLVAVDRVVGP